MQDTVQSAETSSGQAGNEADGRSGKHQYPFHGCTVGATALMQDIGWHVSVEFGNAELGHFLRYLTVTKARALAAALVAAADHHDAETSRLAGA